MKIHSQSYEILKWFPIVFISILVHSGIRLSNNNWSHCPSSGRSGCWTIRSLYCCPPIGFSIRWIWFIIRLVRSVHDRFIAEIKDFIIFRFLAQTHQPKTQIQPKSHPFLQTLVGVDFVHLCYLALIFLNLLHDGKIYFDFFCGQKTRSECQTDLKLSVTQLLLIHLLLIIYLWSPTFFDFIKR